MDDADKRAAQEKIESTQWPDFSPRMRSHFLGLAYSGACSSPIPKLDRRNRLAD